MQYRKLKDISVVTSGNSAPQDDALFEGGIYPFVRTGDVGRVHRSTCLSCPEDHLNEKGIRGLRLFPKGAILFPKSGASTLLNHRAILGEAAYVVSHLAVIIPDEKQVLSHYLYYATTQIDAERLVVDRAYPSLKTSALEQVLIPLPNLYEQKQIVEELDLLSDIIDKQKTLLKELDALAQAIFYDMFGDPVENEMGWPSAPLKELSTLIINGTTPKGGAEVYVTEGIVFFRSQNVWRNRIDYEDVAHIDKETDAKMKRSSLHHNDILITKTGRINTENSSLGRAALYEGETGQANINGHVYLIRLRAGKVSHQFVLRILTSLAYRDYIRKVCVGGIDKRQINKEHVEEFPIILPPPSLQQAFAEKIEAIEKQKAAINESIVQTQKLFDYTIDKYFG